MSMVLLPPLMIFGLIQQDALVNFTYFFKHFQELKNLILNILNEKLIISCPVVSFFFKILLSF